VDAFLTDFGFSFLIFFLSFLVAITRRLIRDDGQRLTSSCHSDRMYNSHRSAIDTHDNRVEKEDGKRRKGLPALLLAVPQVPLHLPSAIPSGKTGRYIHLPPTPHDVGPHKYWNRVEPKRLSIVQVRRLFSSSSSSK
jgi:hypothetical protein